MSIIISRCEAYLKRTPLSLDRPDCRIDRSGILYPSVVEKRTERSLKYDFRTGK